VGRAAAVVVVEAAVVVDVEPGAAVVDDEVGTGSPSTTRVAGA
jgi:hypothetical protein